MKREIKFRAKDYETNEWLYGNLIQRIGRFPSIMFDYEYGGKIHYAEHPVKQETVGQFTGLTDKNGKEIYEGDIFGIPQELPNRHIRVVEFIDDGFFLIDNCDGRKYGDRLEKEIDTNDGGYCGIAKSLKMYGEKVGETFNYGVIGNIHDNPELLKGGEK